LRVVEAKSLHVTSVKSSPNVYLHDCRIRSRVFVRSGFAICFGQSLCCRGGIDKGMLVIVQVLFPTELSRGELIFRQKSTLEVASEYSWM